MPASWPEQPGDHTITVVICLGPGDHDLPRCTRYVEEHALQVVAIATDWASARAILQRGAARAILVAPGHPRRREPDVIVAGPDDVPEPGAAITPEEVHLIRRLIANGECTQEIIRRVTLRRRQRGR